MTQYTLKPDAFNDIKKRAILKSAPLALLALIVGLSISHFNSSNPESSFKTLAFIVPAGIAILVFGMNRGINQQIKILKSFTLTLEEDAVVREQHNTPTNRLKHEEITEIRIHPSGSYIIKGSTIHSAIIVPLQMQHQEELDAALQRIRPIHIEDKSSGLQNRFFSLLPLAALALMAVVYLNSNKWLVGICGTLLTASMI